MSYIENFLFSFSGISYLVIWLTALFSILQRKKSFDLIASASVYLFALFFLGLRDVNSGTDTKNYVDYFISGIFVGDAEPAFDIFTKAIREIGDWELYLFINVAIQLVFISLVCALLDIKNKAIVLLAYISFMPGFDMLTNGMRQGLATTFGVLVWAASFYKSNLPKLTILLVVFFHKSMLAYAPLYFISRIKNEKTLTLLIGYCFLLFLSLIAVWHVADRMIDVSAYESYLSFSIYGTSMTFGEKMDVYMTSEKDILSGVFKYYFLLLIIFFQVSYFISKKNINLSKDYSNILKISFLFFYLCLVYSITWISPYSYRFMYVAFLPGMLLSVNLIINYNKGKYTFFLMLAILISAVLIYGSKSFSSFNTNI